MAIFNPQISPTADPNYLHLSKPAGNIEADKSTGIALENVGKIGAEAIKGADTVEEKFASEEAKEGATKIQSEQIGSLLLAQGASMTNQQDLLPGSSSEDPNVPTDVKSVKNAASSLVNARDNGHVSPTYYYMRLDSLAQNLRSRYPGYRDYIDKAISEVTGVKPANALVQSLMQDLNAASSNKHEELNKTLNDIRSEVNKGNPEARLEYDYVKQTGDISHANAAITKWNARGWAIKKLQEDQQSTTMGDEERKRAATSEFDLTLQGSFDQHWKTIQRGAGLNTPEQISQLINKAAAGEIEPLPPQQKEALLGQFQASRVTQEQDMRAKMYKPYTYTTKDLDGNTVTRTTTMAEQLGGPKAAEERLAAAMKQWDTVTDLVTNEKYGLQKATERLNTAIIDEAQHGLLTDKTLGPWLDNMAAMQKISPQYVEKYFAQLLAKDIDEAYKPYIIKQVSNMIAQPKYAETGIATTFKKVIEDAKNKGVTMPKVYNEYVKALEPLWRNNIPGVSPDELHNLRSQLAIAAFHPDNVGVLKQVQDDYWENGVHKPGAQTIYQRFGQTDAVANMKTLTDPAHWENYVAFMGSEYKTMANKELLNLNDLTKNFPNVFYPSWDPERHNWRLHQVGDTTGRDILGDKNFVPNKMQLGMSGLDEQFKQVQQSMKRLNMVTRPLANVAVADGGNADAAVLQHMMTSGLHIDPNHPIKGLPQQIIDSVKKNQQAVTPAQDWWQTQGEGAEKMPPAAPLQFQNEGQPRGGLKEFIDDPGRAAGPAQNNAPAGSARAPMRNPLGDQTIVGAPINVPNERNAETERIMRGRLPK